MPCSGKGRAVGVGAATATTMSSLASISADHCNFCSRPLGVVGAPSCVPRCGPGSVFIWDAALVDTPPRGGQGVQQGLYGAGGGFFFNGFGGGGHGPLALRGQTDFPGRPPPPQPSRWFDLV